jgi:hypothetical protein
VEALWDLGVDVPYEDTVRLMLTRLRNNFHLALTVRQERQKWFVPCQIPPITKTPNNPRANMSDPVSFWGVLAAPTDERTMEKFKYVVLTVLHPNNNIVARLWCCEEPGDLIENYIRFKRE